MEGPSRRQVSQHAVGLALARASFGAPAVVAPDTIVRLLGLARGRDVRSHRFFAGFFGVRELLLGAFLLAGRRDLSKLGPTVAFGALADLGDSLLLVRELLNRGRVEPATALLLLSGLTGSAASAALWWEVRQVRRRPPPA